MFGSGALPGPLQEKQQYQMLVAKLRQKAERAEKQEALKDSVLSHHTSKTSGAVDETVLESTGGGYVSS